MNLASLAFLLNSSITFYIVIDLLIGFWHSPPALHSSLYRTHIVKPTGLAILFEPHKNGGQGYFFQFNEIFLSKLVLKPVIF